MRIADGLCVYQMTAYQIKYHCCVIKVVFDNKAASRFNWSYKDFGLKNIIWKLVCIDTGYKIQDEYDIPFVFLNITIIYNIF